MEKSIVSARLDADLKRQFAAVCADSGETMAKSIRGFVQEKVKNAKKDKARRNAEYLDKIEKSMQEMRDGRVVVMTMEELEAMAK